jgi:hypothetical protein
MSKSINELGTIKGAQSIRVRYNTGSIFDILSGRYVPGAKGEMILNGGISGFNGFCAAPNMFKSVLMHMGGVCLVQNYTESTYVPFECESSGEMARIRETSKYIAPEIYAMDEDTFLEHPNIVMTDLSQYTGTEFWDMVSKIYKNRVDNIAKFTRDTPMVGKDGTRMKAKVPIHFSIDSFSAMRTEQQENMQDENDIGTSGQNMVVMRGGMGKTQLLMEIPTMVARAGMIFSTTAHMGEKFSLDPYAPKINKLNFLSTSIKLKFVPEQFTYLPNNLWWIMGAAPMYKPKSKNPEYPLDGRAESENDTDLMLLTMTNLRGKSGPSGMPTELVVSQRDGFNPSLTYFRFIKEWGEKGEIGFGLNGSRDWWELDLYPGTKLSRTTVRGLIDRDPKLRAAIHFTGDLCFMHERWHNLDRSLLCTPAELYKDLKEKGYDWDRLLATRPIWRFDQYEHPVPFLSTMDLLRMRIGSYRPYWYDEK